MATRSRQPNSTSDVDLSLTAASVCFLLFLLKVGRTGLARDQKELSAIVPERQRVGIPRFCCVFEDSAGQSRYRYQALLTVP